MKRVVASVVLAAAVLAACSSMPRQSGENGSTARSGAPLPATEPYVQLTGKSSGYLVWPSGPAWLVLSTTDGFRRVGNRTPVAIETDGGLVGQFTGSASAVAVGTTERLYRSPLLTARTAGPWTPAELPGAISDARGAVALRPGGQLSAVTTAAHGSALLRDRGRWRVLTTGRSLDAAGRLTLDSLTWLTAQDVVLTGHGASGAPVAVVSVDGGRSWRRITGVAPTAQAALAPCGAARRWTLPVLASSGREVVYRTVDAGRHWTAGQPFRAAADAPAWGCAGDRVWTVGALGGTERLLVSTDAGRSWQSAATPPARLASLAAGSAGSGFATSATPHPMLWAVRNDGRRFVRVRLPGWVASLGGQTSRS
jgi:hypothetical protein